IEESPLARGERDARGFGVTGRMDRFGEHQANEGLALLHPTLLEETRSLLGCITRLARPTLEQARAAQDREREAAPRRGGARLDGLLRGDLGRAEVAHLHHDQRKAAPRVAAVP